MASRWFVFWVAMFVIAFVQDWGFSLVFLFLAFLTDNPLDEIKAKLSYLQEQIERKEE